jgi:predicted RNA-binding Zn-ribbon protein involved in translation (DUF1610 family)
MVVEYIAVRCFSCNIFQVQQQKKKNVFQCRVCGTKQSVRKVYARAYKAADIRPLVQEYNLKSGEQQERETQLRKIELEKRIQQEIINDKFDVSFCGPLFVDAFTQYSLRSNCVFLFIKEFER